MEKYLVIFLVILLMYTVYQCWNLATVTTEGFADATPTPKPAEVPTNVDTNNSIATLAQLATDLQSGGGLKVPGNLSIGNGTHVLQPGADSYLRLVNDKGTYTDFASNNMWVNNGLRVYGVQSLANGVWHTSVDGKYRVYYAANSRTYFGSQGGYEWRNNGDGTIMVVDNIGTQSLANDTWHNTLDTKNRVYYKAAGRTYFGSPDGYTWRNSEDKPKMTLDNDGGLTVNGITTKKYAGANTGGAVGPFSIPSYPCKFEVMVSDNRGGAGYSYIMGQVVSQTYYVYWVRNGDPTISFGANNSTLTVGTYGTGNYMVTLEYPSTLN